MFFFPSTRRFLHEARVSHVRLFDILHGYVYMRWAYFYIAVAVGTHPSTRVAAAVYRLLDRLIWKRRLSRGKIRDGKIRFADTYHGKVVTLESARKLVTVEKDIEIRNLENIIPYNLARDIVLQHPDHIAVLDCPCRAARKHPCRPLDVCLIVGEPFAGFVLEHHPETSRRITAAEAIDILTAEEERGHVHHAFFKDAMFGRFYAICNCCRCCCGAMQARRLGSPMLASSGYRATVDHTLCKACGTCAKYCQFDAVSYLDGVKSINEDACMGCGVCVSKCPQHAVTLVRDPRKPAPLELDELLASSS